MFFWKKPTAACLDACLARFETLPFTYEEVEATKDQTPPQGYTWARQSVRLGESRELFEAAKGWLDAWEMFPAEFVDVVWPTPPQAGRAVATLFRAPGFWTLNACRIVYTFDEVSPAIERYGFAYGTVGDHLASGEERFSITFSPVDQSVVYEVACFSRARHSLAFAAYPYLRLQQHRFRRKSTRSMRDCARTWREARQTVPSG